MASRLTNYGRYALNNIGSRNRPFATTTASSGTQAPSASVLWQQPPIVALAGLLSVAGLMAAYTGTLQLAYSPTVYVSKKRRGIVPEVEDPAKAINSSNKYFKMSWFGPSAAGRINPST